MQKIVRVIVITGLLLSFEKSFAWGRKGHALIADITKSLLSETANKNIENYLTGMPYEEAANWMDQMRSDHQYDYMKPWHYINIEPGETYIPGDGNNIIDRLTIVTKELESKQSLSTETTTTDILILFHLIGDIFQPLHVGYGSDKGGNTYQVSVNGKGTNLHHVWDTDIIETENISLESCIARLKQMSSEEIARAKNIDFVGWLMENRKLLESIYPPDHTIGNDYLEKNKSIVVTQLVYAGIKLAATLESIFSLPEHRVVTQQEIIPISVNYAKDYIGKKVSLCATVYGIKESANINFINLGAKYPDNPLTLVIYSSDKVNFANGLAVYDSKNVCVTGVIKDYKGKPEIVINKPEDIRIE